MIWYLTIDGETEKHDNEMSYYLKIQKLREQGYNIEYEKNSKYENGIDYNYCYATI